MAYARAGAQMPPALAMGGGRIRVPLLLRLAGVPSEEECLEPAQSVGRIKQRSDGTSEMSPVPTTERMSRRSRAAVGWQQRTDQSKARLRRVRKLTCASTAATTAKARAQKVSERSCIPRASSLSFVLVLPTDRLAEVNRFPQPKRRPARVGAGLAQVDRSGVAADVGQAAHVTVAEGSTSRAQINGRMRQTRLASRRGRGTGFVRPVAHLSRLLLLRRVLVEPLREKVALLTSDLRRGRVDADAFVASANSASNSSRLTPPPGRRMSTASY